MTLGCGGWGGNITSDNISPRHLLNVKRVAYELRPAVRSGTSPGSAAAKATAPALPHPPAAVPASGLDAATMARQLSAFVGSAAAATPGTESGTVVSFVCEEDVRQAIKLNRKITVGERTIITPAARDLAEAHRVFVMQNWR
jgi:hypothetical protein